MIDCAGARTTITADLNRVEIEGVANLTRAFVDHKNAVARKAGGIAPTAKREVVDFANEYYHPFWVVELVGLPAGQPQGARGEWGGARTPSLFSCPGAKLPGVLFGSVLALFRHHSP